MKINRVQYLFEKTYNPHRFNILFDANEVAQSLIRDDCITKYFLPEMFNGIAEILRVEEYTSNNTFIVLLLVSRLEAFKHYIAKANNTIIVVRKQSYDYVFKQLYFDEIVYLNENNDTQKSKAVFIESANNPFTLAH